MAIRKSMEEKVTVEEERSIWLPKVQKALEIGNFKNISVNTTLYQIAADYKKFTVWGEILITLTPAGNDNHKTEILIKSTANADNIYALFKSPNKTIIEAFKSNL